MLVVRDGEDFSLWGVSLPEGLFEAEAVMYLRSLPVERPTVEWVWGELDRVWRSFGLNNRLDLAGQDLSGFYSHPVWVANGAFVEADPESVSHRQALARHIANSAPNRIVELGGGAGSLASKLSEVAPYASIEVIEPYPGPMLRRVAKLRNNVYLRNDMAGVGLADVAIAQDVLEHVTDPIGEAYMLCCSLRVGGTAIFANSFVPVIQCHLPATFYLRHTFPSVMKGMGMEYTGTVPGVHHAQVFTKRGELSIAGARKVGEVARTVGPVINGFRNVARFVLRRPAH